MKHLDSVKITICDIKICFFYLETPCGGLPLLTIDGTVIAQSVAVARFLARECKLDGHSNVQKAQADMIVDCVVDVEIGKNVNLVTLGASSIQLQ